MSTVSAARFPDQRSTYEQLLSLITLAHQNGLYDAADWLRVKMANTNVEARTILKLGDEPTAEGK